MSSASQARKHSGNKGVQRWTDEEMLVELRASAERHGVLRAMRFASDYERGLTKLDTRSVWLRFGSWVKACRAAGYEPGPKVRTYARFTADECIAAIVLAAREMGAMPSIGDYTAFRACEPEHGLPCAATVRAALGGWADALEAAEAAIAASPDATGAAA